MLVVPISSLLSLCTQTIAAVVAFFDGMCCNARSSYQHGQLEILEFSFVIRVHRQIGEKLTSGERPSDASLLGPMEELISVWPL